MQRSAWLLILIAACGGGGDEAIPIDAASAVDAASGVDGAGPGDAAVDAPPGVACQGGGPADVVVDLGGDALPTVYHAAWWNVGHVTKACFEINVVLSTGTALADPYLSDPEAIEITFPSTPVIGANTIQVHLHRPDQYLGGTATLTTLDATRVIGSIDASSGLITVTGAFSANRCDGVFDPCL